ncbi:MAG: YbjP/YqhG family protein [Pseudomonadales bacterium]|jgi:hypothetical protein|nr:YbjP/YqhG family protein [Pseudomonadales bacterium]
MIRRLLLVIALALLPTLGIAQASTPQGVVKAFYTWYIPYGMEENDPSKNDWPIADDKIFEFVDPLAVKQIRASYAACGDEVCGLDADYFTRAQDWDEKDWLKHMTISKPLYSGNKAIVTIQLGSSYALRKGARNHLIVILKKNGEKWLITNVADANDRQE